MTDTQGYELTTRLVRRRQTVERKARFIGQVMRGRLDVREIEDIGDTALSYSEVKALATGDPRILEKARIGAELARLERLERSHGRNQRVLSGTITKAETDLPQLAAERHAIDEAITRRVDTSGDRFSMSVNGTRWSARADAAIALRNALVAAQPSAEHGYDKPVHVATIAGFDVIATPRRYLEPHLNPELGGVPRSSFSVDYDELRSDRPLGIVVKLENRAADLERTRDRIQASEHDLAAEADRARSDYGQPFTHTQALADARARSAQLGSELAERDQHHSPAGDPAPSPEPSTSTTSIETTRSADPAPSYPTSSGRDWTVQPPCSPEEHAQMARDTAADTFTARVPIQQMDRPSVERELRHVHNDSIHYTTAHAARDALNAARASADTPTANPEPAEQAPRAANPATAMELAPPGGWTDADRVQPTSRDTSSYLSAHRYPLGTELTLYAVGEDGPGRRLGHGVVVDHPSPHHVTVESHFGTKRVAAFSHVSLADASPIEAQPPGGHTPTVSETPAQKWTALCDAVDERITADPHWPRSSTASPLAAPMSVQSCTRSPPTTPCPMTTRRAASPTASPTSSLTCAPPPGRAPTPNPPRRPGQHRRRPRPAWTRARTGPVRGAETREFPACSRPRTTRRNVLRPKVALTDQKFHLPLVRAPLTTGSRHGAHEWQRRRQPSVRRQTQRPNTIAVCTAARCSRVQPQAITEQGVAAGSCRSVGRTPRCPSWTRSGPRSVSRSGSGTPTSRAAVPGASD